MGCDLHDKEKPQLFYLKIETEKSYFTQHRKLTFQTNYAKLFRIGREGGCPGSAAKERY
jgi:hypothetical protein